MSTTTAQASIAAILAAGGTTRVDTTLIDTDQRGLSPNPWGRPSAAETGFGTLNTGSVDCRVVFHEDPQTRTVYLVIDETAAPLTGNYVLELDTFVSTYDATAGAPADVDALLTAWASKIVADLGPAGALGQVVQTATRVAYKDPSGSYDAIKLVGIVDPATPADAEPAGVDYTTFSIGASTSCPSGAELFILREVDSASLALYTKNAASITTEVEDNLSAGMSALMSGWTLASDIGALPTDGYAERLYMASQSAGFLRLYAAVETDEPLAVVSSGAGIYGLVNLVAAYLAPTVSP